MCAFIVPVSFLFWKTHCSRCVHTELLYPREEYFLFKPRNSDKCLLSRASKLDQTKWIFGYWIRLTVTKKSYSIAQKRLALMWITIALSSSVYVVRALNLTWRDKKKEKKKIYSTHTAEYQLLCYDWKQKPLLETLLEDTVMCRTVTCRMDVTQILGGGGEGGEFHESEGTDLSEPAYLLWLRCWRQCGGPLALQTTSCTCRLEELQ